MLPRWWHERLGALSRLLYAPRGVTFDALTQRLYVAEEHATPRD